MIGPNKDGIVDLSKWIDKKEQREAYNMSEALFKSAREKIDAIVDWANNSGVEFDLAFVTSIEESLIKYGRLTNNQEAALNNIIKKFHIEEYHYDN